MIRLSITSKKLGLESFEILDLWRNKSEFHSGINLMSSAYIYYPWKNMNADDLIKLFKEISLLLSMNVDKSGYLMYRRITKPKNRNWDIREPEVTFVLGQMLTEKRLHFGLEVTTQNRYQFSGGYQTTALTDLVIYNDEEKHINIELKDGQPSLEPIRKDIEKLKTESSEGSAFFHILQDENSRTMPTLLKKYSDAFEKTKDFRNNTGWFVLFIYIKEKKICYWQKYPDIRNITGCDIIKEKMELNKV